MAVEEGQLEVEAQDEWFGGNAGGVGSTPQGTVQPVPTPKPRSAIKSSNLNLSFTIRFRFDGFVEGFYLRTCSTVEGEGSCG
jgi:hypothetical protein